MIINTKKWRIFLILLMVALGVVLTSGCLWKSEETTSELLIPPLSTTPVSPGYIRSFNHDLGYGYEYPENWTMRSGPEYFTMDGGILNAEMFVDEPEGTSITVIAITSLWKNLDEAKTVMYREDILNERMIEVNGIKGYELTHQSTNYPVKSKMVVFFVNGRIYEFDYGADEKLYNASEGIFEHVVNSFTIKYQ
ncbi:MAG: hypothetical protein K0A89_08750 [ANME-2 cluster archaeon]|nr:hypothetical protein [ANME-2 cluster archaeon]